MQCTYPRIHSKSTLWCYVLYFCSFLIEKQESISYTFNILLPAFIHLCLKNSGSLFQKSVVFHLCIFLTIAMWGTTADSCTSHNDLSPFADPPYNYSRSLLSTHVEQQPQTLLLAHHGGFLNAKTLNVTFRLVLIAHLHPTSADHVTTLWNPSYRILGCNSLQWLHF